MLETQVKLPVALPPGLPPGFSPAPAEGLTVPLKPHAVDFQTLTPRMYSLVNRVDLPLYAISKFRAN